MKLLAKDIKLIINIKKILLTSLIFIMIFVGFSMLFNDYMTEKRLLDQVTIGLIDEENSLLSGMLVENFKGNKEFTSLFNLMTDSEEALLDLYDNNKLSAIVYIPDGFTESLLRFDNKPLRMILNPNYPLQNTVLKNIMSSYSEYIKSVDVGIYSLYNSLKNAGLDRETLNQINEQFSINMVMTALNRNVLYHHVPTDTFPSSTSINYFIYAIIILIILFIATSSSNILTDEDQQFTLQRYLVTGNNMTFFLLSKTVILTLNIMINIIPLMMIMPFITNITIGSYVFMFFFILLVVWFFTTLSLLIGILVRKNMSSLVSSMITLFLGIIGGSFIPIQIMPKFIQDVASLTPNYWILRSCLLINNGLINTTVLYTSLSLLLSSIALLSIQDRIIRRQYA